MEYKAVWNGIKQAYQLYFRNKTKKERLKKQLAKYKQIVLWYKQAYVLVKQIAFCLVIVLFDVLKIVYMVSSPDIKPSMMTF